MTQRRADTLLAASNADASLRHKIPPQPANTGPNTGQVRSMQACQLGAACMAAHLSEAAASAAAFPPGLTFTRPRPGSWDWDPARDSSPPWRLWLTPRLMWRTSSVRLAVSVSVRLEDLRSTCPPAAQVSPAVWACPCICPQFTDSKADMDAGEEGCT